MAAATSPLCASALRPRDQIGDFAVEPVAFGGELHGARRRDRLLAQARRAGGRLRQERPRGGHRLAPLAHRFGERRARPFQPRRDVVEDIDDADRLAARIGVGDVRE